jgi:hypothetical protein
MEHDQVVLNQFAKSVRTLAKAVCLIIIDTKEKRKTPHKALEELNALINRMTTMMADKHGHDLLQPMLDFCNEAKSAVSQELN